MKASHAWLFLLVFAGCHAGCGGKHVDLAQSGRITVEKAPSKHVRITNVTVTEEKDSLVVSGKLRFDVPRSKHFTGHVDITLRDASGQALVQLTGRCTPPWRPHRSLIGRRAWTSQHGPQLAHFHVRTSRPLRPNLTIHIAHDRRDEDACLAERTLDPSSS